jgi:hypothetical protein
MTSLLEIYGKTNRLSDRDKGNTQFELFSKDFDQTVQSDPTKCPTPFGSNVELQNNFYDIIT